MQTAGAVRCGFKTCGCEVAHTDRTVVCPSCKHGAAWHLPTKSYPYDVNTAIRGRTGSTATPSALGGEKGSEVVDVDKQQKDNKYEENKKREEDNQRKERELQRSLEREKELKEIAERQEKEREASEKRLREEREKTEKAAREKEARQKEIREKEIREKEERDRVAFEKVRQEREKEEKEKAEKAKQEKEAKEEQKRVAEAREREVSAARAKEQREREAREKEHEREVREKEITEAKEKALRVRQAREAKEREDNEKREQEHQIAREKEIKKQEKDSEEAKLALEKTEEVRRAKENEMLRAREQARREQLAKEAEILERIKNEQLQSRKRTPEKVNVEASNVDSVKRVKVTPDARVKLSGVAGKSSGNRSNPHASRRVQREVIEESVRFSYADATMTKESIKETIIDDDDDDDNNNNNDDVHMSATEIVRSALRQSAKRTLPRPTPITVTSVLTRSITVSAKKAHFSPSPTSSKLPVNVPDVHTTAQANCNVPSLIKSTTSSKSGTHGNKTSRRSPRSRGLTPPSATPSRKTPRASPAVNTPAAPSTPEPLRKTLRFSPVPETTATPEPGKMAMGNASTPRRSLRVAELNNSSPSEPSQLPLQSTARISPSVPRRSPRVRTPSSQQGPSVTPLPQSNAASHSPIKTISKLSDVATPLVHLKSVPHTTTIKNNSLSPRTPLKEVAVSGLAAIRARYLAAAAGENTPKPPPPTEVKRGTLGSTWAANVRAATERKAAPTERKMEVKELRRSPKKENIIPSPSKPPPLITAKTEPQQQQQSILSPHVFRSNKRDSIAAPSPHSKQDSSAPPPSPYLIPSPQEVVVCQTPEVAVTPAQRTVKRSAFSPLSPPHGSPQKSKKPSPRAVTKSPTKTPAPANKPPTPLKTPLPTSRHTTPKKTPTTTAKVPTPTKTTPNKTSTPKKDDTRMRTRLGTGITWGGVCYTTCPTKATILASGEEKLGKDAMLEWCVRVNQGFVEIKSFRNSSWSSGLGFAGLAAAFRPDLVDFDALKSQCPMVVNAAAFKAAKIMGVSVLLDPEDMPYADDKCIITQIGQYFQHLWRKVPPALRVGA